MSTILRVGTRQEYELIRYIAEGSFGVVYEARDRNLSGPVVVKFYANPAEFDRELTGLQRIIAVQSEAPAALPRLHCLFDESRDRLRSLHPRFQESSGAVPALVMDLVHGTPFFDRMIEISDLMVLESVAIQLIDVLRFFHRFGLRHGDIHPGNILVRRRGEISLIDCSLVNSMARIGSEFRTDYRAPEELPPPHWKIEPAEPIAADLYSVGLVCYERVLGCLPNLEDRNYPIDLSPLRGRVSRRFYKLLSALLSPQPSERLAAFDIAKDSDWLPVMTPGHSFTPVLAGSLGLLVLAGLLGVSFFQPGRGLPSTSVRRIDKQQPSFVDRDEHFARFRPAK